MLFQSEKAGYVCIHEHKERFMQQETPKPHKRRVRYKGKYPKKFEEKYKELNPEKYQDTAAIQRQ